MTLKDWCLRMHPRELNVDERKFIQFGMFYGFVRKLLLFPVAISSSSGSTTGISNTIADGNITK